VTHLNAKIRAFLAAAIGLVIALGLASGFGLFGGPSDRELIEIALKDAIQASREGRPGGVLDFISKRFEVNGEQYGTRDISNTIKDMRPDVEIERPAPTITGDSATITSPVRLSVSLPPVGMNISSVTIHFARENGTNWLIFPTKKWRMVRIEIPDDVVNEVRDQFSGMSQL